MVFQRRPALILPENAQRLGTPGSKPWRDAVAHEKVQTLRGGSNGLLDRGKSGGLGHFDPCHEVRNHVAGAEDGGGVQNATNPLIAADVAILSSANDFKKAFVPHLVVGMINLHPRVPKPLYLILG